MSAPSPGQDARDSSDTSLAQSPLLGLNPVGLMDGVLAGQATDWEPPLAEELEPCFPGYTDFRFLDRGGMGAVYSALQNSLERRVAVKILPPDLGNDTLFVDGFHREARLLARLQHPHVVAIYDFGRNAAGHLFIVMEYVDGTSLLEIMKKDRLPLQRTLQVIAQVCEALQFAHDHGVIHRDIKPTNILIDSRDNVRVADFGLARLAKAEGTTTTQTRSSMIMGTPVYAAPEQRRLGNDVDHRADIFSLGVTLYEMITGHFPVGVFEAPSKKAGSPPGLDKIVTKALRENPAERYQSATEMRQAVLRAADRMVRPMIQRTITKRPMISMMTTIIVTAALIYLFDEVNKQVLQKIPPAPVVQPLQNFTLVPLNNTFSLLNTRMTWHRAQVQAEVLPDAELASIHSAAELAEVHQLLEEHGIHSSVWTGGLLKESLDKCTWTDGTPWDFEAWMPSAGEPPVVVTEIQPKNDGTLRTPRGDTPDWIELHNPSSKPVDLTGWRLTHFQGQGREFFEDRLGIGLPPGSPALMLAPGEYRVIYCSAISEDEENTPQFHFRLEAQRGRIAWADPRGRIIQSFNTAWNNFPANASITSDPAGNNWGISPQPSPGKPNPPPVRPLAIDVTPHPPERQAVMLLPQFNSRWCTAPLDRNALPLIRHRKK
ncbi:protein kinase domain-containing protein [Prosthecobacter vanneervenii]|uniref:Serine/threonine protein kinase n=1 Tax=Prosthecobacter vanneervenii TaxID=48466 RepID=A0A7W7YA19_9BACT|nr:protein kinase [Prosthecobacter vanneervenii]MBB5032392.1 serine/threonine protein kinase [Prosthecobacter vanneervenii]